MPMNVSRFARLVTYSCPKAASVRFLSRASSRFDTVSVQIWLALELSRGPLAAAVDCFFGDHVVISAAPTDFHVA